MATILSPISAPAQSVVLSESGLETLELLEGTDAQQYLYEPERDEVYTEAQVKAALEKWLQKGRKLRVRESVVVSESGQ